MADPQLAPWDGGTPTEDDIRERFSEEGLSPHSWGNAPGDTYARHQHNYHKVLYCLRGSITFHTDSGDVEMSSGDRLDLPPGVGHSATVGPDGVTCLEASRS